MDSPQRSLSLTPITSAVVITLGHAPAGLRLSPLASVIGSPRSSVQRTLSSLIGSGLVVALGRREVRYRLSDHPARDAVLEAALLLSDPGEATSLTLRASPAVGYAAAHRRGFVVVLAPDAEPTLIDRLHRSLTLLGDSRVRAPKVRITGLNELARLRQRSIGTVARPREPSKRVLASATKPAASSTPPLRPRRRNAPLYELDR